ncbi:MAG: hypothetical protein M1840_002314 [Geoglossum simile]|nr:MAG: hypothetical protein M1840_002314 [Geoglossum simile]
MDDANMRLDSCGPHKLAKAFAFCLNDTSHFHTNSESQLPPLGAPAGASTPPQSSSRTFPEIHLGDEYFPINVGVSSECPAGNEKATKGRPVILLVEDNKINLKTFTKKGNYEYDTAENGLLALQAYENALRPYDIIFMGQQKFVHKLYDILKKKQTFQCRS